MAQSTATFPLTKLCPDLIFVFVKQVEGTHFKTLVALSQTCKDLHAIATPIVYQTMVVTKKLIRAVQKNPAVLEKMSSYTRYLTLRILDPNPDHIKHLISSCPRLDSIRLCNVPLRNMPADLFDVDHLRRHHIKLSMEMALIVSIRGNNVYFYLEGLVPECLVSLNVERSIAAPPLALNHLRRFLVQATQLQSWQFDHRGISGGFIFKKNEKMPALKDMSLKFYSWEHSQEQVKKHWDFSRLQSLKLVSVPTINFFTTVAPSDLAGLRTLRIEQHVSYLYSHNKEATRLIYPVVKDHIRALEVLELFCHTDAFHIDAILKHKDSLRVLRFRDHIGFGDEMFPCPTISLEDVRRLAHELHHVHTLELDLEYRNCLTFNFLLAIARFPSLHTLTLNVQTMIRPTPFSQVRADWDPDLDVARLMCRALIASRKGSNPGRPFRRITIIVGGWKKYMTRRTSTNWAVMNMEGKFAERCFHVERDALLDDYRVKEELSESAFDPIASFRDAWRVEVWHDEVPGCMWHLGLLSS